MRRGVLSLAALAALLLAAPADAAGDACVVISPVEKRADAKATNAVADAAVAALGASARFELDRPVAADELRRSCAKVAVAVGKPALDRVRELCPGLPVVYALVGAAEAPGGAGVFGVSVDPDPGTVFGLLSTLAPSARRVGLVFDPKRTGELVNLATRVARARGLDVVALEAESTGAAVAAFHRFERELQIDALWILPDGTTTTRETAHYALEIALWKRLPVIGPARWYVANGALFALLPRYELLGKMAASSALSLLRGVEPSRLQYASDYDLLVSRRAADQLGLQLPPEVLRRATELLR